MKKERWPRIRTSRKSYLLYYAMALVVLGIIAYIKVNDLPLNNNVFIVSMVFVVLVVKSTEVHRLSHHYEIHPHALEKVEGIFVKKHKQMNYHSISQIHLTRNPLDVLLGIGTIELAQFSETIRTEIKNINNPKGVIGQILKMQQRELDVKSGKLR